MLICILLFAIHSFLVLFLLPSVASRHLPWRSLFAFAFHPSSPTLMKQGGSALQGRGGIKLCLIDNVCSNRSRKARVANNKHCQLIHSSSTPLRSSTTSPLKRGGDFLLFAIHSSSPTLMQQRESALQGRGGIKLCLRLQSTPLQSSTTSPLKRGGAFAHLYLHCSSPTFACIFLWGNRG